MEQTYRGRTEEGGKKRASWKKRAWIQLAAGRW